MLLLIGLLVAAQPVPTTVDAGPLKLRILIAETPQLFYVVDQLSGWNEYSHHSYRRYFSSPDHGGLSPADEQLLSEHAALRKQRGYGTLDAAFTTELSLSDGLAAAMKANQLSPKEAEIEQRVLDHFRPRLEPYLAAQRSALDAYARQMAAARDRLASYAALASRFFGGESVSVDVVLAPTPEGRGGGNYSHGQLFVEVGTGSEPIMVLQHELWHAFADPHDAELKAAAAELDTDFETLSEGLAYAVAPGIFRPDSGDQLARSLAADAAANKSFIDSDYVRFNRLGLALRPTLEPALRGTGTFSSYLPTEKAIYRGLAEVALALEHPTPRCFWFGPKDDALAHAISRKVFDIWSRPLEPRFLEELRPKIRPHDVVFLGLVAGAELPAPFAALLSEHTEQLGRARLAATAGEASFDGAGGAHVLVFWAADAATLISRVRGSPLLPQPP